MTHSNEALARLRGITLQDLTTEQMSSVLGPSSISPKINGQFEQANLLARAQAAQRCYSHGLPIPEAGSIGAVLVEPLGQQTIQPEGSELWQITGMFGTGIVGSAVIDLAWYDGSSDLVMVSQKTLVTGGSMIDINDKVSAPFILSNSLYLVIGETGGSNAAAIKFAYHVVSL